MFGALKEKAESHHLDFGLLQAHHNHDFSVKNSLSEAIFFKKTSHGSHKPLFCCNDLLHCMKNVSTCRYPIEYWGTKWKK